MVTRRPVSLPDFLLVIKKRDHGAQDYADLAFSRDSRYLYGSSYGALLKWAVVDGRRMLFQVPEGEENLFSASATFIPGAKKETAWIFPNESLPYRWNVKTKKREVTLAFTPLSNPFQQKGTSKILANSLENTQHFLIDTESGGIEKRYGKNLLQQPGFVDPVRVSPNGVFVAERSVDKKRLVVRSLSDLALHRELVRSEGVFCQDWQFVSERVVVSFGSQIEFWDVDSKKIVMTLLPNVTPLDAADYQDLAWVPTTRQELMPPRRMRSSIGNLLRHFGPMRSESLVL